MKFCGLSKWLRGITLLLVAATLVGMTFSNAKAGLNEWSGNGPDGGFTYALVADPQNPLILYAGTDGGVFRSINGGESWSIANSGLTVPYISALAINPFDPATLFAGTYGGGVFKSSNGGGSWSTVNNGLSNLNVYALSVDPQNPTILYAGTEFGVFKSIDEGGNWSAVNSGLTSLYTGIPSINVVAIDPQNPAILYAGTNDAGMFKSINGGASWAEINNDLFSFADSTCSIAIDPQNSSIIYAGTRVDGVFKTVNGGANWTQLHNTVFTSNYEINALAIDPQNPATVYFGSYSGGVSKSIDGGTNWSQVNSGLTNAYIRALIIDRNSTSLIAGTNGGVFKSSNGGGNWNAMNNGFASTFVKTLTIDPQNPGMIFAGTYGNGVFRSTDYGNNWSALNIGVTNPGVNGGQTSNYINHLVFDPTNPVTLYAATQNGLTKSTNGGVSWTAAISGLTDFDVRTLAINPQNPDILYAGTYSGRAFKSYNGGGNWTEISSGLNPSINRYRIEALVINPQNPNLLYAGTWGGGVFGSSNGGASWSTLNVGLTYNYILSLAIDPQDPSILYVGTYGAGIFKSSNGGSSWSPVNTGITMGYIYFLAIDPQNPALVYAGTNGGVFKSANGGSSWSTLNSSMTNNSSIYALAIDPQNNAVVYAGTEGSGVLARTEASPEPKIQTSKGSVGSVNVSSSVAKGFLVANNGLNDLVITSATITGPDAAVFALAPGTCGGLAGTWSPGLSCAWQLIFTPTSTGPKFATLTINSSDPGSPSLVVPLSGTGVTPTYILGVILSGTGSGRVNSTPGPDISCTSGACGQSYTEGTVVTLSATPNAGSIFGGWLGACSDTGPCTVTMNEVKSVTGIFTLAAQTAATPGNIYSTFLNTSSFQVSWSASSTTGATYVLERSSDGGVSWAAEPQYTSNTALFATIPNSSLPNGSYQWRVKAVKAGYANSGWKTSAVVNVVWIAAMPASIAVPTSFTGTSFVVSWPASTTPGVTYVLERSSDGGINWAAEAQYTTNTALSAALSGISNGSYQWRVKAQKASYADSAWKTSIATNLIWTTAAPATITVPTSFTGANFLVSWKASTTPGVTYDLERSSDDGATWATEPQYTNNTQLYATISGIPSGSYQWRVKAVKTGYAAPWKTSGSVNVAWTAAVPATITVPTSFTGTSFVVSWPASTTPGVTYVLERSSDGGINWAAEAQYTTNTALSATISGISNGSYQWRVKAQKASYADSAWKTSIATNLIWTTAAPATITAPATNASGSFRVSWGASTTPGATYVIERSSDGGNTWTAEPQYAMNTLAYVNLTGIPAGSYKWRTKAVKTGYADSSWKISGTTLVNY